MRNYVKYRSTVIDLFQYFLAGDINAHELNIFLINIRDAIKKDNTKKEVWFRFFKGDTVATTIADIYYGISNPTNERYYRECMQLSIDNPKELKIYFS